MVIKEEKMAILDRTTFKRGAVSLYIVIFTTLLISIITVSFLRIMLNEQQQTVNTDLAQSAYDSALAGAEDAKTLLMAYQDCISRGSTDHKCTTIKNSIESTTCDTLQKVNKNGSGGESGEVVLQVKSGDPNSVDMSQAYTCVTIETDTTDFVGKLDPGKSKVIPLRFTNPGSVKYIEISWYTQRDNMGSPTVARASVDNMLFRQSSEWDSAGYPAVLRTQLIQTASSFTLSEFDSMDSSYQTNRATLFLYPTNTTDALVKARDVALSSSKTSGNSPTAAQCLQTGFGFHAQYACRAVIELPKPYGGAARSNTSSFLRLTGFYKSTEFRVVGSSTQNFDSVSNGVIRFDGVQPSIDSTGRANNVFRRVISRVEMIDVDFPFPEFAVEMDSDQPFCKAMLITDDPSESIAEGDCY
jgi:hypothetical protein